MNTFEMEVRLRIRTEMLDVSNPLALAFHFASELPKIDQRMAALADVLSSTLLTQDCNPHSQLSDDELYADDVQFFPSDIEHDPLPYLIISSVLIAGDPERTELMNLCKHAFEKSETDPDPLSLPLKVLFFER